MGQSGRRNFDHRIWRTRRQTEVKQVPPRETSATIHGQLLRSGPAQHSSNRPRRWKAVYGGIDPEVGEEADDTLPPLTDGEAATPRDPRVEAKRTVPPPRYNEGTLIDAMQNSWRFVQAPAMRERLKEAKGIGTPATRAEIIKGLKRQNLLAADGKLVVPTPAGLQLFELLRDAAPAPGRSRHHSAVGDAARRGGHWPRRLPGGNRRHRRGSRDVDCSSPAAAQRGGRSAGGSALGSR